MHIEEAIEQCVEGNVFIAVRSYMEKQALLDLLQDPALPAAGASGRFRESNTRDDRPKIEFHDLLLEDTPIALDVNSISGLL